MVSFGRAATCVYSLGLKSLLLKAFSPLT